jgi:hypothetical protein
MSDSEEQPLSKRDDGRSIEVPVVVHELDSSVTHLRVAYTEFNFKADDGNVHGKSYIAPHPVSIVVEIFGKVFQVRASKVVQALVGSIVSDRGEWPDIDVAVDKKAPPTANKIVLDLYHKMLSSQGLREELRRAGLERSVVCRAAEIEGERTNGDVWADYLSATSEDHR